MIVKLVPGPRHTAPVTMMHAELVAKLISFGLHHHEIRSENAGYHRGQNGRRTKQPDGRLRPLTRRTAGLNDAPSFVIEVGDSDSETMQQLRLDARFWLMHTNNQTNLVLPLNIDSGARTLVMERWERGQRNDPTQAQPPPPPPQCVQTLTLQDNGTVHGAPLHLPVNLIFDTVPAAIPNNEFIFNQQALSRFAQDFWVLY